MTIKVVNIISFINRSIVWEWMALHFAKKSNFDYSFIVLNEGESELVKFLNKNNVKVWKIKYRGKRDFLSAFYNIIRILLKEKPQIINTNLIDASVIGQLAGWLVRVKYRINTRHHSSFHHDYFPKAIKYDKLVNYLSTHIVTASSMVKDFLITHESVPEEKITVINFGFNLNDFENVTEERLINLRNKYFPPDIIPYPVIGVISRFVHWKGIQYIIPAFERVLVHHPNAFLILANASGDYKSELQKLLSRLPPKSYRIIEFETDVLALYALFDIFIHTPIDSVSEAFGQVYIEALGMGIPSIFTISGIASEFIKDRENALVVDYKNSDSIYNSIIELVENAEIRKTIIDNGKVSVKKRFMADTMLQRWETYYSVIVQT